MCGGLENEQIELLLQLYNTFCITLRNGGLFLTYVTGCWDMYMNESEKGQPDVELIMTW